MLCVLILGVIDNLTLDLTHNLILDLTQYSILHLACGVILYLAAGLILDTVLGLITCYQTPFTCAQALNTLLRPCTALAAFWSTQVAFTVSTVCFFSIGCSPSQHRDLKPFTHVGSFLEAAASLHLWSVLSWRAQIRLLNFTLFAGLGGCFEEPALAKPH